VAKKTSKKSAKPGAKSKKTTRRGVSGSPKEAPKAAKKPASAKSVSARTAARKPDVAQMRRIQATCQGSRHHQPQAVEARKRTRTERPLTAEEIEQFRQLLLQKRSELLGDVSTLHNEALKKDRRDAAGDLSSMPIHMADLGTDNFELEFTLGLIEGERAILREIDAALDRIRAGTYGICEATGKPIGRARLRAKPWARYCYEYTLAQEQGLTRRS